MQPNLSKFSQLVRIPASAVSKTFANPVRIEPNWTLGVSQKIRNSVRIRTFPLGLFSGVLLAAAKHREKRKEISLSP